MKNLKRGAAAILALSLAVALPGCGAAPAASGSNSASTSITELAAHEFTDADLQDLFEVPEIYFVQNAENVNLIDLLDYDTDLIQKIALEGGTLDLTQTGEQSITLLLTVDQAKLAQVLKLEDGNTYSGTVDLKAAAKIDVIAEADIAALLTEKPDVVIVGTDNQFYELATPVETEGDGGTAAEGTDGQPTEATPVVTTAKNAEKPKVTTKKNVGSSAGSQTAAPVSTPSSNHTAGAAGNANNGSSTNTATGKPNQATSNTGSTGSAGTANTGTASKPAGGSTNTASKPNQSTGDTGSGGSSNSGSSAKPSGGQTGGSNTGSSSNANNTPAATPEPPKHEHSWEPVYTTVHHDEVGHYETVTVQEAYDEQVKDYRAVCSVCGEYFLTGDAALNHVDDDHGGHGSYNGKKVVVDTIHHDAVTEQKYVVDQAAYDEQVISGYKCSCGETK